MVGLTAEGHSRIRSAMLNPMSESVDRYLALSPIQFPQLRRLTIYEFEEELGPSTSLEMIFYGEADHFLTVRCSGVRDLVFQQPWTSNMLLHALQVTDISARQLEGIRFEVRDVEGQCISFTCRTFEAE